MSSQIKIDDTIYQYIVDNSLRENKFLKALGAATLKTPHAQMLSAPDEVQFISLLLKAIQAKNVIEVGVFTGYTTLAMALTLPKDGRVIACDISEEWVQLGQPYWEQAGVKNKIDLRIKAASETLQTLSTKEPEAFDLIYIDADKQGYDTYYELSLKLTRKGGLIVLDNMLRDGKVADPKCQDASTAHIRTLTQKLHHDNRIEFSLLPLADGVGICVKN
jgi:predicted O-methyltransferase YrrM